jgi:hypothetical protein
MRTKKANEQVMDTDYCRQYQGENNSLFTHLPSQKSLELLVK